VKLTQKINLAVFCLLVLSSLFVGIFFAGSFRDLRGETYRWFDEGARQLAVTIGNQAKEAVGYFDYGSIEKSIAKQVAEDPNLLYVHVAFDENFSDSREAGTPGTTSFRPYVVEIMEGEKAVVQATINYSTAVFEKKLGAVVWRLVIGSGIALFVLMILLYALVSRFVSRPLIRLVEYAEVTASGDLTLSIDLDSTDEFGTLAATLNKMSVNLRAMIEKVSRTFDDLERVSGDITDVSHLVAEGSSGQTTAVDTVSSSIEEMNSSIKSVVESVERLYDLSGESSSSMLEMSASVEQVAGNAEGLSSAVETTSSNLDKMSGSIRSVAENTGRLTEMVTSASSAISEVEATVGEIERNSGQSYELSLAAAGTMTGKGLEALGRTAEGIREISRSIGSAADVVRTLEARSHEIGSILDVINDVNDQTNLLALNAAIIAAQAGEHGRGFAVVADEIRELSARTASSTEEIKKIISSVQQESQNAVVAMEDGTRRVKAGEKIVADLDVTLRQVAEDSEKASSASRGIAQSTKEQYKGIRQIAVSAEAISEMAQEIAAATRGQSEDTTRIIDSARQMRELAEQTKKSTAEQAKGIKITSKASEESARLSQQVLDAAREEAKGSGLIVQSVGSIQEITKKNEQAVKRLDGMVSILAEQSKLLKQEIRLFKIVEEAEEDQG
jgi:methyl-accepting chemotaxis protein